MEFEETEPGSKIWIPKRPKPAELEPEPEKTEKKQQVFFDGVRWRGLASGSGIVTASDQVRLREVAKTEHEAALEEARKAKEAFAESEAKRECEALLVIHPSGHVDHQFLELLKCVVARNRDGSVNYRATLKKRKEYCDEYEWRRSNNLPVTP